jgi:hypothetical protein
MSDRRPLEVFRISLTNASMLSALYLMTAVVVEGVRRTWNPRWAERLSLALEAFPARTLEVLGLLEPLRQAWLSHTVTDLGVRVVYGATTVALIFTLGLTVGAAMWALLWLFRRWG